MSIKIKYRLKLSEKSLSKNKVHLKQRKANGNIRKLK